MRSARWYSVKYRNLILAGIKLAPRPLTKRLNAVKKRQVTKEMHGELLAVLPNLRRFALSLTGSIEDAEDLLHSTIEKALTKLDQFEPGTDLDRWLFRICKNTWLDEWRQRKVRGPSVDPGDLPYEPSVDGEATAVNNIELQELNRAMQALPEEQRTMLVLIVVEGYSYKEVSSMLDVPIGTVMSRLARARKKVADTLTAAAESRTGAVSSHLGEPQ